MNTWSQQSTTQLNVVKFHDNTCQRATPSQLLHTGTSAMPSRNRTKGNGMTTQTHPHKENENLPQIYQTEDKSHYICRTKMNGCFLHAYHPSVYCCHTESTQVPRNAPPMLCLSTNRRVHTAAGMICNLICCPRQPMGGRRL